MAEGPNATPRLPDPGERWRRCGGSPSAAGGWPSCGWAGDGTAGPPVPATLAQDFLEAATRLMADPAQLAEAQAKLWQDYLALWQGTAPAPARPGGGAGGRAGRGRPPLQGRGLARTVYDFIKQATC